ncbi:MAG: tyrosine-type recombinase/integrase [Hyphomicrobiaceae bacterium]|nr:tyrosine-type recombinase/integrase [Hyphomicrobiaceae bacterium]
MPNGCRTWIMRITICRVRRDLSLGPAAILPLAEARDKAHDIRKAVAQGRDPRTKRPIRHVLPPAAPAIEPTALAVATFKSCWQTYWLIKEAQLSSGKHRDQWISTMGTYVLPLIGARPIADIKPGEIIDLLKPIWTTKEETARRVLQRIDAVFVSAITRELRDKASPCTGVARELGQKRGAKSHHAALPYDEVGSFLQTLRNRNGALTSRLAFEFLILTAVRSGEARGATWNEIDMLGRVWTIGAARMKVRNEHSVPLSDQTISILKMARLAYPESQICFPNVKGKAYSDMVFTKMLHDMGFSQRATAHGFRTSFKTWAAETGVPDDISEAALAHTDPNKVRAAYLRTTFFEKRRTLMQSWANFVTRVKE